MNRSCYYCSDNKCELLTSTVDPTGVLVPESWCRKECWPNNPRAQRKMLERMGVHLPPPPEGLDLLKWAEQCKSDGTVKYADMAAKAQEDQEQRRQRQREAQAQHQAIAQELKLPNALQQAANLGKHLREIKDHKAATGRVYVCDDWAEARRAICRVCEKAKEDTDGNLRCTSCGCNVKPVVEPGLLRKAVGKVAGKLVGENDLGDKTIYEALTCDFWKDIDQRYRERPGQPS